MPHDVIMPALGMAQDKGVLVAWLKQEGDEVREGDPLFEVETDKATMEVEAQGAGFLIDLRAAEGDSVPVGEIIARIAETAGTPAAKTAPPEDDAADDMSASVPEGRKVIMPALGMAQDTGRIVGWAVAAGDSVSEGDTLFEVETDKATMEVAAECDGYVAAILAEAGDDVPVGETIAVISGTRPEAPVSRGAASEPQAAAPAQAAAPNLSSQPARPPAPIEAGGRILASPKARRLAQERGIDLARLVAAGLAQPFHAADLDRPEAAAPAPRPAMQLATLRLSARAPAAGFDALIGWAEGEGAESGAILAALASGALRETTGAERIAIELRPQGRCLHDADLARPDGHDRDDAETPPTLILRDLTATRLTAIEGGTANLPALTLSRDRDDLVLSLSVDPETMDEALATGLLAGFADRIADPLRQLF
ncbi:pyruvate dehydrogenase [Palleronia sediminis]|uniref:Pyruvate dehydrogenase n=1 Tax=Palleronia sediminis TaxID=2547833 RepID=A0A4R6A4S5_9RHOB|nr:biotin/lipoyl-containing protein [Palleronia sediminis]TDL77712.1 pyruvate dehydrogenase [Palleronia sediminis]